MIRSVDVKNLSKSTIKKIRRMIKAVKAEPEFYDQETFGRNACEDDGDTVCGTVCCGAGWAVWLDNPRIYNREMKRQLESPDGWGTDFDWMGAALKALGLVDEDGDSDKLFGGHSEWPNKFAQMYRKAKTPAQRAAAFEARWEHFIATDGQD